MGVMAAVAAVTAAAVTAVMAATAVGAASALVSAALVSVWVGGAGLRWLRQYGILVLEERL